MWTFYALIAGLLEVGVIGAIEIVRKRACVFTDGVGDKTGNGGSEGHGSILPHLRAIGKHHPTAHGIR